MERNPPKKVLIVDDDLDFSETLRDILEPRGIRVHCAGASADACDAAAELQPDVALVDLRLGNESGVDLITMLKKKHPGLVCIMMTAYADLDSAIKALQDGAYDYMRKPLNSQDLLVKLERIFERLDLEAAQRRAEERLEVQNRELEEHNQRLRLLVRSATVISSCTDLEHFPKQLLIECAMSLRAKCSAFYMLREDHLDRITFLGHEAFQARINLPLEEDSILRAVIDEGDTVYAPDITRTQHACENEFGFCHGSVLVLPLLSNERITEGFVVLHNPVELAFTANDRELAILLASFSAEVFHTLLAGEALREGELRYRTLLQNLPGAVLRCKVSGDAVSLVYASDKLRELTGRPAGDFIENRQASLIEYVHEEDRQKIYDRLAMPVRYNLPFEFDIRIIHKSGKARWVTVRGTYIPADLPNTSWVDCALFDITERVEAQEAQQQLEGHVKHLQKLESLGVLAGGIAHDFNNLMVPIMGYADMLLEDLSDNDFARESLHEIQQAVERARDLVQQILTFSRQTETEKLPTQMHLVVKQALKLLRSTLPATIEIVDRIDRNAGMVLANPTQLHQVVMNIGTNAFHAMEKEGGKLDISLRQVAVDHTLAETRPLLVEGDKYAVLEIRDNGVGMDEDTLSRIFDPFFTTKEPGKGTGLGLATTHGIISELEGDIWAESAKGVGTTFHIYLPTVEYLEEIEEANLDHISIGRGEHILVVDDDKTILDMSKIMLSMLGYTAVITSDSLEALEMLEREPQKYLVVLTDYTMPKKTGCDIAEAARALRPDIPIIMTSGHGDLIPQQRMEELKINATLPKPYKIRDLAACLQGVLQADKTAQ